MSLINDALKKVEKSLNDNTSGEHPKQSIPPLPLEASGGTKKIFFITLIGGTLFFSILILLFVLIFSNSSFTTPANPTPTITPEAPSLATIMPSDHTPVNQPEETLLTTSPEPSSPPSDIQTDETQDSLAQSVTNATTSSPPSSNTSSDETDTASTHKNLDQEFFKDIVNLASKAFIGNTGTSSTQSNQSTPKENYRLSTAQKTLDMLEQESKQTKNEQLPETQIQKFLDSLSITGVMISKEESMVLINNRIYLENSMLNPELHLKLIEIHPQNIILQDQLGTTYTVDF